MMPGHSAASCARGQGGTRCSSPLLGWASKFRVGGVGPGLTVTYLAVGEGIWIARGTKSREKHEIGHRFRGEGPFPCSLHRAAAFSVVRSGQGSRRRRTGGAGEGCEPSTAAFRVRSGQGPRRRRWGGIRTQHRRFQAGAPWAGVAPPWNRRRWEGIRSSTGSYRPVQLEMHASPPSSCAPVGTGVYSGSDYCVGQRMAVYT